MNRAATSFSGLDERHAAAQALHHITPTRFGYQIRISRGGKRCFNRSVYGKSTESLREAMSIRDEALARYPNYRINRIPEWVLQSLGLSAAVPGITRVTSRSCYRVHYNNQSGRERARSFYYRVVSEDDAYAAAIAFRQSIVERTGQRICGIWQ